MPIEQRLRELGLELPTVPKPAAKKVINGCSDLFAEVFGEKHARSAVGVGSLPFGITVEIEAVFEVDA